MMMAVTLTALIERRVGAILARRLKTFSQPPQEPR
jgi:hypothetical protein